jgi:hypothetical protein
MESELFGHEKGAFTDAKALKRGLVELATGGTLFLDEIGALPLDMQTKLLVFLEVRQIRRVGGNDPIPATARVIAATSEDLREAVRAGRFREDLLYRLDVASIRMPSLHAMPGVVAELAVRFTQELAAQFRRAAPVLSDASLQRLQAYAWPGTPGNCATPWNAPSSSMTTAPSTSIPRNRTPVSVPSTGWSCLAGSPSMRWSAPTSSTPCTTTTAISPHSPHSSASHARRSGRNGGVSIRNTRRSLSTRRPGAVSSSY